MLNRNENRQMKMCVVTLEELMPQKHFLRDLDKCVDFSFIYEKVEALYSNTGRPSVDPVMLVKMLLIGYLYGIESERRLEQEIRVNIAYRWFLGIELDEPVPDHSTISQLRHRKFSGTKVFQDIFDEIVRKCIEAGLVTGKLLLTDSTHIRANARNDLREIIEIPNTPSEYMQKLDREAYELGLIKEPVEYDTTKTKKVTKSITDPDSGLLNRPGKPNAFCYLNHQTCDSENGIITDVFVTPGNVSDNVPHTARIECQINKFDFHTKAICADAGYDSPEIYTAMSKAGIKSYIPIGSTGTPQKSIDGKLYDNTEFIYDRNEDIYICPNGKTLAYSSYRKGRGRKRYISKSSDCKSCPLKEKCIGNRQSQKTIDRHLHADILQEQRNSIDTPEYFRAMRLRQIWCEGNFAHQKEQHNLRRTFKRGIEKVTEQCLLSACALNLKRLVKAMRVALFYCSDIEILQLSRDPEKICVKRIKYFQSDKAKSKQKRSERKFFYYGKSVKRVIKGICKQPEIYKHNRYYYDSAYSSAYSAVIAKIINTSSVCGAYAFLSLFICLLLKDKFFTLSLFMVVNYFSVKLDVKFMNSVSLADSKNRALRGFFPNNQTLLYSIIPNEFNISFYWYLGVVLLLFIVTTILSFLIIRRRYKYAS